MVAGINILVLLVASLHLVVNVDHFYGGISINKIPSLAKVLVHLRVGRGAILESKLSGNIFYLLSSVSNVNNLEIKDFGTMVCLLCRYQCSLFPHSISVVVPSNILQVLGEEPMPFQEFENLRNLLLDNCGLTDNLQTRLFLQNSPNLEKLTLLHCKVLPLFQHVGHNCFDRTRL